MKKYDYYITIDKEDFHIGLAVVFAGDDPGLDDRWFLPVSMKLFYELSEALNVCMCYHEPFEGVKND